TGVGLPLIPVVQIFLRVLQALETLSLQWRHLLIADPGFHLALAIGIAHPARQRDDAIVGHHVAVERVQRGIVDIGPEHAFGEVVEHHHAYAAPQPPERLFVQLRPDLRAGLEHQQPDRLAAVAEGHHEQARAAVLAGARIADHRPGAVIDLSFFAGVRNDDRARLRRSRAAELADVAFDALVSAREGAVIDEVLPDRHGIAAFG